MKLQTAEIEILICLFNSMHHRLKAPSQRLWDNSSSRLLSLHCRQHIYCTNIRVPLCLSHSFENTILTSVILFTHSSLRRSFPAKLPAHRRSIKKGLQDHALMRGESTSLKSRQSHQYGLVQTERACPDEQRCL